MKIYSVTDAAFRPYGKILEGYDTAPLCAAMRSIPMPEQGTAYEPSIPVLEECALYGALQNNAYGGMPIQLGLCWGYNTRLNCLEYHRDSEVNVGARDFILLLGKQDEIENGVLDTGKVKAFRVPAGMAVEVYATTLHYAPCHTNAAEGFCTAVVLPRGTNTKSRPLYSAAGRMLCCGRAINGCWHTLRRTKPRRALMWALQEKISIFRTACELAGQQKRRDGDVCKYSRSKAGHHCGEPRVLPYGAVRAAPRSDKGCLWRGPVRVSRHGGK